jgi:hypothetical protein
MRRWLPLLALSFLGCASASGARVPDPARTGDSLVSALRADDPRAAYGLLHPQLRATLSQARFTALWRDNRGEMLEFAERWTHTDAGRLAHARVSLADGEQPVLVLEQGQWRLEGGVLDAQALDTPLDAVAELRRALQRQSLPSLLRVLARERRAAWLAAFDKSMQQTRDPLDLQVEVHGDEAVVHLTGGGQVLLKREAGRWQVWDVR